MESADELLKNLGLECNRIGPDTLVVRQVPALLRETDVAMLLLDLIADLRSVGDS
ncbi:MAG: hypothetical protein FD130_2672, partial [Halothiobacillaceae bacterium]